MVYAKPPFGGAQGVLEYLARYTHRVAISNDRLVAFDGETVTLRYKEYRQGGRSRLLRLPVDEFLRRLLLGVLPDRFVRIRYYGFLAPRTRTADLRRCRELLQARPCSTTQPIADMPWQELLRHLTGSDPTLCPSCGTGHLVQAERLPPPRGEPRAPP